MGMRRVKQSVNKPCWEAEVVNGETVCAALSGYKPTEDELTDAIQKILYHEPGLGWDAVYQKLEQQHKNWILHTRRVAKFVKRQKNPNTPSAAASRRKKEAASLAAMTATQQRRNPFVGNLIITTGTTTTTAAAATTTSNRRAVVYQKQQQQQHPSDLFLPSRFSVAGRGAANESNSSMIRRSTKVPQKRQGNGTSKRRLQHAYHHSDASSILSDLNATVVSTTIYSEDDDEEEDQGNSMGCWSTLP